MKNDFPPLAAVNSVTITTNFFSPEGGFDCADNLPWTVVISKGSPYSLVSRAPVIVIVWQVTF